MLSTGELDWGRGGREEGLGGVEGGRSGQGGVTWGGKVTWGGRREEMEIRSIEKRFINQLLVIF